MLTEITDYIIKGDTPAALIRTNALLADGKDVRQLIKDLVSHYRNLLLSRYIKNPEDVLNLSLENAARIRTQSETMALEDINRGIMEFSKAALDARYSTQPRVLLELAIVKLSEGISPEESITVRKTALKNLPEQKQKDDKEPARPEKPKKTEPGILQPESNEGVWGKGIGSAGKGKSHVPPVKKRNHTERVK